MVSLRDAERQVAAHYARGDLYQAIEAALARLGKTGALAPADLAPVDEFHVGGRIATIALAEQAGFPAGARLLDIGCGIGGASRWFASERGCRVIGIDLTAEYCDVARRLAERVGLAGRVDYRQASALDLPFAAAQFDGTYMLHVGMNIADKAGLFAEVRRVLKPGAIYAVYDIMKGAGGAPHYPVPWAAGAATSFLATSDEYAALLGGAGFRVERTRDRRAFGVEFYRQRAAAPVPTLGTHLLMGADAPAKIANMVRNMEEERIAPTEIVARAV